MPVKLVLGPANSAKAGHVLGAYAAAAPRGALLVVPTAVDAHHYQRELSRDGAVFGSVLTFSGLAREIARRTGYVATVLSPLQRDRLLAAALASAGLDELADSAAAPGFRRAAAELIAELERSLVTPQRFVWALRRWVAAEARNAGYAEDLGRIYSGYARTLDRVGRVDRELYAWRALDSLRASPGSWGRAEVFLYGFDELTALERDAVETLGRIVGADVTVSMTYEAGRPAMAARASAVADLSELADETVELPPLDSHYAPASRTALHHLERGLFGPAHSRVEPGAAIALLEAGGERAEAELIAGQVLELLDDGVPGDEIAVVYRSQDTGGGLIASVFAQYGIVVAGASELPLSHTPLGRALRGAARCALAPDGAAGDLLDYLRAPGLLTTPQVADRLEAGLLRDGVSTVSGARERLGWNLGELDALASAGDPAAELARLAGRLLAAPHRGAAAILTPSEELDARALATLTLAFEEIAALGERLSAGELVALLDELMVPLWTRSDRDAVLLTEPLAIRARRFRVVFICGLQEGEFPLPARPDPFLSDERRRELATCSGLPLRGPGDGLDRERYLFYTTASRATERVVLSYRSSDEEGNLELPSPFIADVAELLVAGWPERRKRRLLADVVWDPALAPTARERERSLAAARAAPAGEPVVASRALSELALRRLRHTQVLSAGALENYADCPVKWLVERELRPQPLAPESEALVRGNVIHGTLERVLRELGRPLTIESLGRALEILGRVIPEQAGNAKLAVGRPEVVREAAVRAIDADLRRYLTHEAAGGGRWRPRALEQQFGFDCEGSLAPLELGDGSDRVKVRGAIDRIDTDGQGRAIVRDYKSGAARSEWPAARWVADRQLQVALYMLAVRELTDLQPAAGFYQPLRGDNLRPRGIYESGTELGFETVPTDAREANELAAELDEARARAVVLASALRRGELTPCPQTCTRDGCAYPGICRSQ